MKEAAANQEYAVNAPEEAAKDCPCHGDGWILTPRDTFAKCWVHFSGQPHPDDAQYETPLGELLDGE